MDVLLSAELTATCNSLGYFDKKLKKYYTDTNTLEAIKDLIRYLRKDDDTFGIRRELGEIKVLHTDLLPLLKFHSESNDIFEVLLRLLVNLTTPALVLFQDGIPIEITTRNYFLQIEDHLHQYKESFADETIWTVISARLSKILEIDYAERGEENSLIIERILILIRNVLYVPIDHKCENKPDNEPGNHDQILWSLYQSGIFDIILYIASCDSEKVYYMHILEVICFIMRDQSGSNLSQAALSKSEAENQQDGHELLNLRQKEVAEKRYHTKSTNKSSGYARFNSTYVVQDLKSIGNKELICHKPLNKVEDLNFDDTKHKTRIPKNRLPMKDTVTAHRSGLGIRLFLKEFCVEFLNAAYNTFMYTVRGAILRAKAQDNDESYYMLALRFFMEFNRCHRGELKLISETVSMDTFYFVQKQCDNYLDHIQTDKKKFQPWSYRLHLAILAYRELLLTIYMVDKSKNLPLQESIKVIKGNIFYTLEYRELLTSLLFSFDELKMSHTYLLDLIETHHIFLKMLEHFCGHERSFLVEIRARNKSNKKNSKNKSSVEKQIAPSESKWEDISQQLTAILEDGDTMKFHEVPFDATLDVPIDDQKATTMWKIQMKLRHSELEGAIGLFRAAREVWPENNCFGTTDMSISDEFSALQDVFFADLSAPTVPLNKEQITENIDSSDDENEEDIDEPRMKERDINFTDIIKRLVNPKIVRACTLALDTFDKNSAKTNSYIIKLLHRIAFDCKMYSMLFQVSLFQIFRRVYIFKQLPQYKEIVRFADYIIKQFVKVSKTNKLIYVEALFWKTSAECYDVEHGYGQYRECSIAQTKTWSELQEEELRRLFMEHSKGQIDKDVIDWILENLIDHTRTRRGIIKKLKEMDLLRNYKGTRKQMSKPQIEWGQDEENLLKELFQQYKDTPDPLECIMKTLPNVKYKKHVIKKLIQIGLINSSKDVRRRKHKNSNDQNAIDLNQENRKSSCSESSSSSDSDSDDETSNDDETQRTNTKTCDTNSIPVSPSFPKESAKNALKQIVYLGMLDAINWLKETLQTAFNDIDNDEDIPLLPVSETCVSAMESEYFQSLLTDLGIKKSNTYWCIPSTLDSIYLKEIIQFLDDFSDADLIGNSEGYNKMDKSDFSQKNYDSLHESDNNKIDSFESDYMFTNKSSVRSRQLSSSSDSDIEKPSSKKLRIISSDEDE